MSESEAPPTGAPRRLDPALLKLSGVLLVGACAALLDSTIITVAIDGLSRAFGAPVAEVQWVATAYLLAMTAVIPVTGWIVDRHGQRAAWIGALALFGAGSALCAAAWSVPSLVALRVVTGLGGGMLLPLTMTILVRAAGQDRVGRALALVSVPGQLAPVLGPVLGGLVLDSLGWRWVFLATLPLTAAALALAVRGVPADTPSKEERIDLTGLALLPPGLAALLYGLSVLGEETHGPLLAAGGVLLLAGFAVHALRRRPGAPPPLIDLRLFSDGQFRIGAFLMFVFGLCIWGGMFLLPLFYQQVTGADALAAGVLMAPMGAGVAVAVLVVGRPADRVGPRPLVVGGLVLAALATLPFGFVTGDTSTTLLGAVLFVRGLGLGTASVPLLAAAYRGLAPERVPRATSALNVTQRIGAAAGTAGLAFVLTTALAEAGQPAPAFQTAFWWMTALTAVAVLPALFLPSAPPGPAVNGTSAPAEGGSPPRCGAPSADEDG
ncbi:DHA2 family efflux MFS transporter permease subunit [Nocardiopsis halotolerans]|uniref:DHA2 family efflux MFS transporter permease subunit n=1 Tax=Nocardiopsis halotolerans TaxID=124252 RepID=UPI0003473BCC|nr:DHA2 family efflux MFS transporter permease subunit [Nocardiopsis halotolerans]